MIDSAAKDKKAKSEIYGLYLVSAKLRGLSWLFGAIRENDAFPADLDQAAWGVSLLLEEQAQTLKVLAEKIELGRE